MTETQLTVEISQRAPIPLDVRFTCRAGRTLALVGPSGAGKSTILRTIAGLYRPQSARIICNDAVWLDTNARIDRPPHERRTGLVFQSYALFPHLTALANVEIALQHLGYDARRRAAQSLLDRVNLSGLGARRPSALSGGEQQRVALARALARDPDVLLLDEPFAAIDRRTRRLLKNDLAGLRTSVRAPIILVTHDLDEAVALADDIVVIDHGRMLQSGTVSEVLSSPATADVRSILDLDTSGDAGAVPL